MPTVQLSNDKETIETFYATVTYDGGEYRADLTLILESEDLARHMASNRTGP